MNSLQKKKKNPSSNNESSSLEVEEQEIPKIDDLVGEIDSLLKKTKPKPKLINYCGC